VFIAPGTFRGQFEVFVDGEVIASKPTGVLLRWLGVGWPDQAQVVEILRGRLAERGTRPPAS